MNKFDQLNGLADYDDSLGFLKKIKKAASKVVKKATTPIKAVVKKAVVKPVTKLAKATETGATKLVKANVKVAEKLVVQPIQHTAKIASPILANPAVQAVAAGAAMGVGAGPLVIAGLQVAGKAASANEANKAAKKEMRIAEQAAQEVADAEYVNAVNQMKQDGMTDQQIQSEWLQSETYRQAAIPAVAKTLTPIYQQQYRAAGVQNWEQVGETVAAGDAIVAVDKVQKSFDYEKLIIPGALLLGALVLLKKK